MGNYRIAVIPGDGIGTEVVPQGIRVLQAVGTRLGITFTWDELDWGTDRYLATGRFYPEGGLESIRDHDAIFLGAVGDPRVADHVSLWGLLIPIRRVMHQWVNLRPVRLMPGVCTPLRDRTPEEIDFVVVRENSEGEYSEIGGRHDDGSDDERVEQTSVFTRRGVNRILRYAFDLARSRRRTSPGRAWPTPSARSGPVP